MRAELCIHACTSAGVPQRCASLRRFAMALLTLILGVHPSCLGACAGPLCCAAAADRGAGACGAAQVSVRGSALSGGAH